MANDPGFEIGETVFVKRDMHGFRWDTYGEVRGIFPYGPRWWVYNVATDNGGYSGFIYGNIRKTAGATPEAGVAALAEFLTKY